mgnify:CR=1 FL=1
MLDATKVITARLRDHYAKTSAIASAIEIAEGTSRTSAGSNGGRSRTRHPLLVSIPCLPSSGAELSPIARFCPSESNSEGEGGREREREVQGLGGKMRMKTYMRSMSLSPDLCLVQPRLLYRARMDVMHERILAQIATAVDVIFSDKSSFLPELLAWDALRTLVPLLDRAIYLSTARHQRRIENVTHFDSLTVHDDETDHRSQFFRRYVIVRSEAED